MVDINNNTFVIFSKNRGGFLGNDETTLTTEIDKAKRYSTAGEAIKASVEKAEEFNTTFQFFEL